MQDFTRQHAADGVLGVLARENNKYNIMYNHRPRVDERWCTHSQEKDFLAFNTLS